MVTHMVKVTFTLDDETVARLKRTAERLRKPRSLVVREAVADYAARADHLSEGERIALLEVFDRVVPAVPPGPAARVDAELRGIRERRRAGGRRRGRTR